jgi:alkaline phosphatase D
VAKSFASVLLAALLALPGAAAALPGNQERPSVSHGVVVGDVTPRSAVLWARADRGGTLQVKVSGGPHRRVEPVPVTAADDWTGQARLTGLIPGRHYSYRVRFGPGGRPARGSFKTPPAESTAAPVRLAFGGDVAGQNVCRDAVEGFPILDTIHAWRPDLFIGLGDMIYADNACTATGRYGNAQLPGDFGPATDLAGFWAHWRYNRADPASQRLLANTSYVGVWDDHEVINDFGPLTDIGSGPPYTPGVHLLPIGLQAFLDYTPIATAPRLYRSLRWGRHLELFVLDTRSFRDANFAQDSPENPKTMLGHDQLAWLERGLASSDATWKVIVSSVPMSIPTGFPPTNGRDGWANFDQTTGFENELLEILGFMAENAIHNTVWITTDVHFAKAFRYAPFTQNREFAVHEIATGPLNAGIFPIPDADPTLNPQVLFFNGPASADDVTNWDQAKRWFNFGTLAIEADGDLTAEVIDTAGEARFSLTLKGPPEPEPAIPPR